MEKHTIQSENAKKIHEWIDTRGGIFIWHSIDLSNPDKEIITPALTVDGKPYQKPHWSCSDTPARHITDVNDIIVSIDKEVKRFHVAVRFSSNGLSLKVTDGGSRRIRKEVEKAGDGAYYVFDYSDYNNAVIKIPSSKIPLSQYIKGVQ